MNKVKKSILKYLEEMGIRRRTIRIISKYVPTKNKQIIINNINRLVRSGFIKKYPKGKRPRIKGKFAEREYYLSDRGLRLLEKWRKDENNSLD